MASRFNIADNIFPALSVVVIVLFFVVVLYLIFVKIPADMKYCADRGLNYINIDRSWACLDPKTRQLYK